MTAAIDLSHNHLGLDRAGKATVFPDAGGPPPTIDGLTFGAATMTRSAPHGGELHPDGDELLYLVSGGVDLVLERDGGEDVVALRPGQAFIVPRGVWHRVTVREPSHLLYLTPGPHAEH